jgi:hypothetical protein
MNSDDQPSRKPDSEQDTTLDNIELNDGDDLTGLNKENPDVTVGSTISGDVLKGLKLKDTWHSMSEICQREIGGFHRNFGALNFASRVGASVQLVRRLILSSKLEGHTGCVNALHFNESGKIAAFCMY